MTDLCPGSGKLGVPLFDLNLRGCPECRYAWDPDLWWRTPDHPAKPQKKSEEWL